MRSQRLLIFMKLCYEKKNMALDTNVGNINNADQQEFYSAYLYLTFANFLSRA